MSKRWLEVPMWFSPDEPPSGGAPAGSAQSGNGAAGTVTPPGNGGQPPASEPPKFTQADLDRLLGERALRAEEATQKKILEGLGVASLDDLKKIKEEADKLRQAQMSDLEKAQQAAQEAQAKVDQAFADRDAALAQATQMLMRSALLAEATKPDYRIRPEAMADVWSFVSADKALLDKIKPIDGKPGEFSGVDAALKDLLKAKVYMVDTGNGQGTPRQQPRKQATTKEEPRKGFTL